MAAKRIGVALPLIVLSGVLGIFLVPWFVPHWQPVVSVSYTLGFNNMIAALAFAGLLAALFFYLLRRPVHGGGEVEKILARALSAPESHAGSRNLLIAFGVTTMLTVGLLLGRYLTLPYIVYGDFGTDASRLDLMVLGLKPYRDFQYNYGPAMLYPAYWLYKLANGRMSIDAAYCANLLAHWVAGLFLLYYTVRSLCRGLRGTIVFLCCSLAVFNLTMGVAYTPLRFLAPTASLLFLHRTFGRWIDGKTPALFKPAALAVILPLSSLSLSPEIGVATAAGTAAFFAALSFTPLRRYSIVALAPLISLGLAVLLFSVNYTEGLFSFGGGANNLPVFPTPHVLFLVAAACITLPLLGVIGVRERSHDGALAIGLVVGLGLLLPAAFGRCDPMHLLYNGLGVMVFVLAAVVQIPNRTAAALTVGVFLIIHPTLMAYSMFRDKYLLFQQPAKVRNLFSGTPGNLQEQLWNSIAKESNGLRYGKLLPFPEEARQLLQYKSIGTPFWPREDVDRFLKLSGRYLPEYYAGFSPQVFTTSALDRKIRDLRTMDTILVPQPLELPALVHEAGPRRLSQVLFVPKILIPQPRRSWYSPTDEVFKYIQKNFTVIGRFRRWDIWRRIGGKTEPPS